MLFYLQFNIFTDSLILFYLQFISCIHHPNKLEVKVQSSSKLTILDLFLYYIFEVSKYHTVPFVILSIVFIGR